MQVACEYVVENVWNLWMSVGRMDCSAHDIYVHTY